MNKVVRCILIEDEQPAVEIMQKYISNMEHWILSAVFDNPVTAEAYLSTEQVDVMFLDIQLPRLNGMEFLRSLDNPPIVVITSAFSEHAIEAFELVAFDYLLKPFSFDRLQKTVRRIDKELMAQFETNADGVDQDSHLIVTVQRAKRRIRLSEIQYIESLKEYISITTTEGVYKTKQGLTTTHANLPENFLRIHRSFVVNIDHVATYSQSFVGVGKRDLPIGQSYKNEVSDRLATKS